MLIRYRAGDKIHIPNSKYLYLILCFDAGYAHCARFHKFAKVPQAYWPIPVEDINRYEPYHSHILKRYSIIA